jgi:hypothetical protein
MNYLDNWTFSDWWGTSRVRNIYWWVRHRVDPSHRYHVVRTGLKPGYYDVDTLMLHSCMALLCRYVEHEREGEESLQKWIDELIEMSQDPEEQWPEGCIESYKKEMEALTIYRWWKYQLPYDKKCEEYLLNLCYSGEMFHRELQEDGTVKVTRIPPTPEEQFNLDWHEALEYKIEHDEQEMLHRLIEIRGCLWT